MADKQTDSVAQQWVHTIALYEREFKSWEGRARKIVKRYRDEERDKDTMGCRFNILWSNVRVAIPAVFSRLPRPDVSRRFKDSDPVGRVAALILERALEFETEHYPDFRESMKSCVQDRFLGGRGVPWVRYEPQEQDGELATECCPTDYVYWKDFGHTIARTWDEVTGVWRKVYMGREALVARFGPEGEKIPLDTKPEDVKKSSGGDQQYEAMIYEIWDKKTKKAMWLSKSLTKIIDSKDDPLKLDNFWPCPKPLYATLTNGTLVPVPDFALYQDQANTLDTIADRIEGLIKALQVKGVYDATFPELSRLFTEGQNGTLLAVKNFQAFAEKQGLKGSIDLVDLTPIFNALKECYAAAEQQKAQIYEIMGLADIIRGSSDPNETATAQKMKGNWGSMSLRSMQQDVSQFATEILQIKAQIICGQFQPQTIAAIGGADMLSETDQQYIEPALQLLKNATLRDFRIEVVADSMIYMDELQEKQDRMELLNAISAFLKEAVPAATQTPELGPLLMELLKFGVTAFKVGKTIEGIIDQTADQLKQMAAQPRSPKQDPAVLKVQAEAQADQQRMAMEDQQAQKELQAKAEYDKFKAKLDAGVAQAQQAAQAQQDMQSQQMEAAREAQKLSLERYKIDKDAETKIAVAEIAAKATLDAAQLAAARAEAKEGQIKEAPNANVPG